MNSWCRCFCMHWPITRPSSATNKVVVPWRFVVVGHGSGPALFHGEARLGAVERLDLRLLVRRQDDGALRRVEIQVDHILKLLGKSRVVRQLESRHQVRLQAMRLPDRLNARRRDAHRLGQRTQAPVGGVRRRFRQRLLEHPIDHLRPPAAPCRAAASCRGTSRQRRPRHSASASAEWSACSPAVDAESRRFRHRRWPRAQSGRGRHASAACCHWRSTPPADPDPCAIRFSNGSPCGLPTPSNGYTGSSSAGSRPNVRCPTRKPRPCCSGP